LILPQVVHAATSGSMNCFTWGQCQHTVKDYWNKNPHPKRLSKSEIALYGTKVQYLLSWYITRQIPFQLMKVAASLPVVGSKEKADLIAKYGKALARSADLNYQFNPFTTREWRFDGSQATALDEGLTEKTKQEFSTDAYDINWDAYTRAYSYGMIRYIMKSANDRSPPIMPKSGSEQFLRASL